MSASSENYISQLRELQAIAQNGLAYSENPFDIERFKRMREIVADMIENISFLPAHKILAFFEKEIYYATPKLGIRGIVFDEEKRILLVKERADNLWTLPGGWVDINESPSESVIREIYEESGFKTQATKLIALYDKQKHDHPVSWVHTYDIYFLCKLIGGKATPSLETSEVQFFSKEAIPELSTPRVTHQQILRFYEHLDHPEWPTDFD